MPLDQPAIAREREVNLQAGALTSNGCTGAAAAIDDDPATSASFGTPASPWGSVTPSILSVNTAWFNGGANFPAGKYIVVYQGGALKYSPGFGFDIQFSNGPPGSGSGYSVTDGAGNNVWFGGPYNGSTGWPTEAAAEAAFAGTQIAYNHVGGPIGVNFWDNPVGDNVPGTSTPTFTLLPTAGQPPRFLRIDWGSDRMISRVRLLMSGAGASNAGISIESSLSYAEGGNPPAEVPIPYIPLPVNVGASGLPPPTGGDSQGVHELILDPPMLARGIVFYPDAMLNSSGNTPGSYPAVTLSQLQVYESIPGGYFTVPISGTPTTMPARLGCSGLLIYPYQQGLPFPFSGNSIAPQGIPLLSIQGVDFEIDSTTDVLRGGETRYRKATYETEMDISGKFSVEQHDYRAFFALLNGQATTIASDGQGPEQQYFRMNKADRLPYFTAVVLSTNGDPSENTVLVKAKVSGKVTRSLDYKKLTIFEIPFVLNWDDFYPTQDGQTGGIWETRFTAGADQTLHS